MENDFDSKQMYSYQKLKIDLNDVKKQFPDQVELITIGSSVEGRDLYALRIGSGKKAVLCHGAHHAREWMTTRLIVDFINHLLTDCSWPWLSIREDWLTDITFWFIPMVNPDGVTLVQGGINDLSNRKELIDWNNNSTDFTGWKANSRGVDLNRQYPADWESIQADPGQPSSSHYKGSHPLSEPETQAIYQFVKQYHFDCAIAYHSSGEEIFWRYTLPDDLVDQHRPLAERLAEVTRYRLIEPEGTPSGGGFTDWFLTQFQKPAFTIEIAPSIGPRPVPDHLYKQIFQANELVLYTIASYLID
ncbi:M14 family metallopeptidase [Amphibacillus sp. Q70]|uniref:M14 family metallopeptidase n=1 Tax=Amphibacillus sp. Q70 TaxID=3453416 RepID=UPI003F82BB1D